MNNTALEIKDNASSDNYQTYFQMMRFSANNTSSTHNTSTSSYSCELCGKSYQSAQGLKYHVDAHRGIYPYRCPYCQRGFLGHRDVKQHLKRWHGGVAEFRCQYCKAGEFEKLAYLKEHLEKCEVAKAAGYNSNSAGVEARGGEQQQGSAPTEQQSAALPVNSTPAQTVTPTHEYYTVDD